MPLSIGDCIAEIVNSTRTDLTLDVAASLTNVLVETTNSAQNASTITYLYGLGLVGQSSGGATEYHLTDALGSARQLADPSGSILLSQTFDPYSNRYEQSSTSNRQSSMGLTYLRARYYQPSMGRFTQIDPFGGALAIPASMNGYGYAHGNSDHPLFSPGTAEPQHNE